MNKKNKKTTSQIKFSAVTIRQRTKLVLDILFVNKCSCKVAVVQVHLQYFLSSQITHNNVLLHVFKSIMITLVFIYINVNLIQNKLNKNHRVINMRAFNWSPQNFESLYMCHIHSKETNENATRKQRFLENINVPCIVRLLIIQSYVYALKMPSEVKMFSH